MSRIYREKVDNIIHQIKQAGVLGKKIKIVHGSTNSTRSQLFTSDYYMVYTGNLKNSISCNEADKTITVESGMSNDDIFEYAQSNGLCPRVLAEFPGITAGGAVQGASLESSSWKYGQFNDQCTAYDVILSDGTFLEGISADNYSDLFYGISGSYGSLAVITAVTIQCDTYYPYVQLNYIITDQQNMITVMNQKMQEGIDFCEGIVWNDFCVIVTGNFTHAPIGDEVSFSEPKDEWYYIHVEKFARSQKKPIQYTATRDYLFRYNRGAFWMGRESIEWMHLPFTKTARHLLNVFMNTRKLYDGLHALNIMRQFIIQDAYLDEKGVSTMLDFVKSNKLRYPVWICPMKTTQDLQIFSPHMNTGYKYVYDVGVYGKIPKNRDPYELNTSFEKSVQDCGGKKMLYAENFYSQVQFWEIYNKSRYDELRLRYNASGLDGIFSKIASEKHIQPTIWKGILKMVKDLCSGKNIKQ
jgi:hypothetical protein